MAWTLIANPNSGRGRAALVLPRVRRHLDALGRSHELRLSSAPGELSLLARRAAEEGSETLVVLGGDGSLFEALNGVMGSGLRPRLAQLPLGTGNSFVKDLGIEDLEDGLAALGSGRSRRVDLGRARAGTEEFFFVNVAGAGFVARVARRARAFKFLGDKAYVLATLLELPSLRPRRLDIIADGLRTSREAIFVEICNSRKTGGDMIMAPRAELDDGRFDVVVARAMSRRRLLSLFPLIFEGRHVDSPFVEYFRCSELSIDFGEEPLSPDGELLGSCPLHARVEAGALEFLVP